MDPRHQKRIKIIQELYSYAFQPKSDYQLNSFDKKTIAIINKQEEINSYIAKFIKKFPVEKIAKIDLAILQLAVFELIIEKKEPGKVIINEAVELAHEFGGKKSYAFVNAILGKIYQEIQEKIN